MRRHESRRGARVTGEADLEGVEPRKIQQESADGIDPPAGNNPRCAKASGEGCSPGSEAVSSLTLRVSGNQGDPCVGPLGAGIRERV